MRAFLLPVDVRNGIQDHTERTLKKLVQATPEPYKTALKVGGVFVAGASLAYAVASSIRGQDEFDVPTASIGKNNTHNTSLASHKASAHSTSSWGDSLYAETVQDIGLGLGIASLLYCEDIFPQ